ncbi:MAG: NADH:flavin oxidoreductase/NADH oxidase family protein [Bacteroidota bacterium]
MSAINQPFTLPCGETLNNRIAKAALTEKLADPSHLPNEKHLQLYKTWAKGGAGLLISGNILVDERYLESAGNVVAHALSPEDPFKKWTKAVTDTDTHFWAQLNHAGRQSTIFSTLKPVSASDVQLKKMGLFAKPRPLTEPEIEEVIQRFVNTAVFCRRVGFTGVQFHAAHGYLLNQFLSPKTNLRTDQWGGAIENRAKLLLTIVERARKALGHEFPISVKLNSADFQRGGFDEADALFVIKELAERGIDLLEVSGGTYEEVTFFTQKGIKQSTKEREAYFLDFAKRVRAQSNIPIMVTGGFRTLGFCNKVLENKELDIIGFGRPFLLNENFAAGFLDGSLKKVAEPTIKSPIKAYYDAAVLGFYEYQISRIATGQPLNLKYSGIKAILRTTKNELWKGLKNKTNI